MAFTLHSNALIALASAASWGGGDFSGGMAVRAANAEGGDTVGGALRVVILAHAISLAVLVALLALQHAPLPHGALLAWGLCGGAVAGLSLTAFYIALSRGAMGAAAAISGLLAAAIPATVSTFLEGAPTPVRLGGFGLAATAIWLIAAGPAANAADRAGHRLTTTLAIVGGVGFGFYFVCLRMDNPLGVLEPLALCRSAGLASSSLLLLALHLFSRTQGTARTGRKLSRTAIFWALGVALLDTGGNLLFVAATRIGRLDVAAVLASLYPAGTILLAGWFLRERPTRQQFAGMAVALAAVVMITL